MVYLAIAFKHDGTGDHIVEEGAVMTDQKQGAIKGQRIPVDRG